MLINTSVALAVELRPHRAPAGDRHAHDQPAGLPFLRASRSTTRTPTRRARWPSTIDVGQRLPDASPYRLREFPLTRRVLGEQITAVVNVDDPHADPAEVAELRREGDRSLLMVPLVVQGRSLGLLEVVDQKRSRQYSRQELRLAEIAGQAAVAIQNAKLFAERRRSDEDVAKLREALAGPHGARPAPRRGRAPQRRARRRREAVCEALGAISCVASVGGESAGAFGAGRVAASPKGDERGANANLVIARDPSGGTDLTLAVTLPRAPGEGQVELLDFVAAVAAVVAAR